jgi:hypothetical protein
MRALPTPQELTYTAEPHPYEAVPQAACDPYEPRLYANEIEMPRPDGLPAAASQLRVLCVQTQQRCSIDAASLNCLRNCEVLAVGALSYRGELPAGSVKLPPTLRQLSFIGPQVGGLRSSGCAPAGLP